MNWKNLLLWQRILSVTLLLALLAQLLGFPITLFQRLEWISYDTRIRASLSQQKDPNLVMIDIDEKSLREIGQWPWPRDTVAELVNRLFDHEGISILGMDVIFAEEENKIVQKTWQAHAKRYPILNSVPAPISGDQLFAQSLKNRPIVMGYYFQHGKLDLDLPTTGQLPTPIQTQSSLPLSQFPWFSPIRYSANLPILQQAATSAGFFDNPAVDGDGVFRRVPLVQYWQGQLYPSLPLAMLKTLLDADTMTLNVQEGAEFPQLEGVEVGGFYIPTDARGSVLVPYRGGRGHFESISAADVLKGRVPEGRLAGAMGILGSSAPGLMDLRSTPVDSIYPGPEIHLTVLSGLLQQDFKSAPPFILGLEIVLLIILGVFMTIFYPKFSAPKIVLFSVLFASLLFFGNGYAWQEGLVLPFAHGFILLFGLAVLNLLFNLWRESREKHWVTQCFGQYIPPELVEEMVEHPDVQGLDAQERELSVLFSDIRGFTGFSEKIPPAELSNVMQQLLSPLTAAIHSERGTIDKYMGDAVMAFWGAPIPDEHHAEHALRGAFSMLKALEEVNHSFKNKGLTELKMGVGINSGIMSVGNMGSNFRMAYTVLGDNVNLGSRLEGLTKHYGVSILVSESTAKQVENWYFRRVDKVRVKGRNEPLWIYEPLGECAAIDHETHEYTEQFHCALDHYFAREFEAARKILDALPDHPLIAHYRSRIETYLAAPPPDTWDGVWTHTEK